MPEPVPMRMSVLTLAVFLLAAPVSAADLSGSARVIDGDTLEVAGETLRLHGIDAPETRQDCPAPGGGTLHCGEVATQALRAMVAGGVDCDGRERDRYGRLIAVCRAGGDEVNAALVARGLARAYTRFSDDYADEERAAASAGRGFWDGGFPAPWAYRSGRWQTAGRAAPEADCPIKGNVSSNGRIYHAPWSRWYDRTRIDPARGERWFCSEAEAVAAGWRPPRGG